MPNIRKFYFENAAGQRFGLNGERGVYLTAPEGLGYELDPPWADLGRGFFSELDDEIEPQGEVVCQLIFVRPAYSLYRTFADWIAAAGSLLLIYCPFGAAEYQKAVSVEYLQKGELDKTRLLHAPLALKGLSPWRLPEPAELAISAGTGLRRARYGKERGQGTLSRYGKDVFGAQASRYGADAAGAMAARIAAAGHLPGAVLLRYHGALTNPSIRLTGVTSGKVYGICRLPGAVLAASDVLELSTLREDAYVRKNAADGSVASLLAYLDLSQQPFFEIPQNEDSILSMTSDTAFAGSAELLIYRYYRTV